MVGSIAECRIVKALASVVRTAEQYSATLAAG